jgi:preprotein translocase subunit SecG
MLTTLLVIVHVVVSVFLVVVVLLQTGKGAEMGAAFGGASQTLFGGKGGMDFMEKLTTASAILFMVTSLSLAFISTRGTAERRATFPTQESMPAPVTDGGQVPPASN